MMDYSNLTVLYVEDDAMTREEVLFSLSFLFDTIYVAQNGEIGLELFYAHLPDFIITDVQMPIMDGLSMLTRIKETHPKIPIIIMTAFNDTAYLLKAIELGISHYVTKPVNLKVLTSKINEIVEQINLKKVSQWQAKLLQQYKKAIDKTMAVSKTDLKGTITYVNERYCILSGYSESEIIGQRHSMFRSLHEKDEKFIHLWESIIQGNYWHNTIENRTKSGDHFILDQTIFPLYDAENKMTEFISIGNDVTELFHYRDFLEIELHKNRKNLAETLHFLEQYQEALQTSTAVCHMSIDGAIIDANETFCTLLGYEKSSILEMKECLICEQEQFSIDVIHHHLQNTGSFKKRVPIPYQRGAGKNFCFRLSPYQQYQWKDCRNFEHTS